MVNNMRRAGAASASALFEMSAIIFISVQNQKLFRRSLVAKHLLAKKWQ